MTHRWGPPSKNVCFASKFVRVPNFKHILMTLNPSMESSEPLERSLPTVLSPQPPEGCRRGGPGTGATRSTSTSGSGAAPSAPSPSQRAAEGISSLQCSCTALLVHWYHPEWGGGLSASVFPYFLPSAFFHCLILILYYPPRP